MFIICLLSLWGAPGYIFHCNMGSVEVNSTHIWCNMGSVEVNSTHIWCNMGSGGAPGHIPHCGMQSWETRGSETIRR